MNSQFASLLPKCARPFYEHLRSAYGKVGLYDSFLLSLLCTAPKIYSECYVREAQHLFDECLLTVCEGEFCQHDTIQMHLGKDSMRNCVNQIGL